MKLTTQQKEVQQKGWKFSIKKCLKKTIVCLCFIFCTQHANAQWLQEVGTIANTASICSNNSIVTEYSTTAAKCTLTVSILDGAIVKAPLCYSSCEGIDLSNPNINTSIINLNVTG